MPQQLATNSVSCPGCKYPIVAPTYVGEQVKCPYCGEISQAISQVTIPTSVVVGVLAFIAGVILGPVVHAAIPVLSRKAQGASERLAKRIK